MALWGGKLKCLINSCGKFRSSLRSEHVYARIGTREPLFCSFLVEASVCVAVNVPIHLPLSQNDVLKRKVVTEAQGNYIKQFIVFSYDVELIHMLAHGIALQSGERIHTQMNPSYRNGATHTNGSDLTINIYNITNSHAGLIPSKIEIRLMEIAPPQPSPLPFDH